MEIYRAIYQHNNADQMLDFSFLPKSADFTTKLIKILEHGINIRSFTKKMLDLKQKEFASQRANSYLYEHILSKKGYIFQEMIYI